MIDETASSHAVFIQQYLKRRLYIADGLQTDVVYPRDADDSSAGLRSPTSRLVA
jgi:hypothetical protein